MCPPRFLAMLLTWVGITAVTLAAQAFGDPPPEYRVYVDGSGWCWMQLGGKQGAEAIRVKGLFDKVVGRVRLDEPRPGVVRIGYLGDPFEGLGYSMKAGDPALVITKDVAAAEWEKIPYKDPKDRQRVGFHLRVANGPHKGMYLDFDPEGEEVFRTIGSSRAGVRVHKGRLSPTPTPMSLVDIKRMGDLKADSP